VVPEPVAGPGETVVEVEAAGVNFGDIKQTAGEQPDGPYSPKGPLPRIPGMEVVGRTADGRRVLGHVLQGGYAERTVVAERDLVTVPEGVSAGEALAREFGAGRVIATASSEDKRASALDLGADVAIDGEARGYRERVLAANDGRPVDIVLDAIGGPVLDAALDTLGCLGRLVTYGASARQPASAIAPSRLAVDSLTVAGFWLTPLLVREGAGGAPLEELLDLTARRRLRPLVGGEYPLGQARQAHEDLLARRTKGKLILVPGS
jgi:NADPH2:quinone reductase